ncbi:MAG: hypothetical protein BM564_09570 [Bacteroidetes bacterium MedPE-SWsnd-G2]|nr:MAG: hypothetical protein BM564_09570 [Bacteroidetes bacterium MedPE-SWsnd-G2]
MVLNNLDTLLEKYDNGETSIKEEEQLRTYFANNEVPAHLESYKMMFQYFNNTKQEAYTKTVPLKPRKSHIYQWISVAAVLVVMFGLFKFVNRPTEPTADQLAVYNQTKEALNLVSSKFNRGQDNMRTLGLAAFQFQKASDKVDQVNEISKSTKKILKKSSKK